MTLPWGGTSIQGRGMLLAPKTGSTRATKSGFLLELKYRESLLAAHPHNYDQLTRDSSVQWFSLLWPAPDPQAGERQMDSPSRCDSSFHERYSPCLSQKVVARF